MRISHLVKLREEEKNSLQLQFFLLVPRVLLFSTVAADVIELNAHNVDVIS